MKKKKWPLDPHLQALSSSLPPQPPPEPPPKSDYENFLVWLTAHLEKYPSFPKPLYIKHAESDAMVLGRGRRPSQPRQQPFLDTVEAKALIQRWSKEYQRMTQRSPLIPTPVPFEQITEIRDHLQQLYDGEKGEGADIITQSQADRDRHTYIIGKSGSGKTTLMRNMIYQDLRLGNGLAVIAPEQEMLTEEIMPFIPEDRLDDVIYFNPADSNPIPFNPLHLSEGEDPELKTDENLTIFKRIIGGETGIRMEGILRQAFSALIEIPHTTLLDIPKLLDRANPHFRQQVISQLQDDYMREFWRDRYPELAKDAHLPILNRLAPFLHSKKIRKTLCNPDKSLNFREVMDTGKVILFNLSDGILGPANSQLLGQLIVSQFQVATASRANIPQQDKRRRFYLYIDEFQTFTGSSEDSFKMILSRARKYRLALILAHQGTSQIPDKLLQEIFNNVSTMVSFMVSHHDATKLSKEFIVQGKPTPPEHLIDLEIGETFCKLGKESFKMKTPLVTQKPNPQMVDKVIERSRNWQPDQQQISPHPLPKEPDKSVKPTGDDDIFSGDPKSVF